MVSDRLPLAAPGRLRRFTGGEDHDSDRECAGRRAVVQEAQHRIAERTRRCVARAEHTARKDGDDIEAGLAHKLDRHDFLLQFAQMAPTHLELAEKLEQLRALENGYRIRVVETGYESIGVDTPGDLEEVLEKLKNQ